MQARSAQRTAMLQQSWMNHVVQALAGTRLRLGFTHTLWKTGACGETSTSMQWQPWDAQAVRACSMAPRFCRMVGGGGGWWILDKQLPSS